MWYQKLKVSCLVVFRDEGTFGPTTVMLFRGSRTNLDLGCHVNLPFQTVFFEIVTEHNYV